MNKITEQQFHDLLALKLSGDATVAQLALLAEQLSLNPQWQFLYDQAMQSPPSLPNHSIRAQQAWAAHVVKMHLQGKLDEIMPSPSPEIIQDVIPAWRVRHRWRYMMAGVAAMAIVVVMLLLKQGGTSQPHVALNEITTRKGSKSNIKLPDGTQVWLNADSKLVYSENFYGPTREVTLTGEAYFDVTHDSEHPFIIHTGKANIRVVGTAFNVKNYPQDKSLETTLMRGKIEVSFTDRPGEKIVMKPLEKLIVRKEPPTPVKIDSAKTFPRKLSNSIVLTSVTWSNTDSLVAETSWMSDKMVFVNQPLEKIAREMERHFGVTVVFKNTSAGQYRYTGVFDDITLEKVLQIIQLSKKINYTIENKTVIIY
jgi:ferric-dicitrate binding protein FerR (iron transport regulator)